MRLSETGHAFKTQLSVGSSPMHHAAPPSICDGFSIRSGVWRGDGANRAAGGEPESEFNRSVIAVSQEIGVVVMPLTLTAIPSWREWTDSIRGIAPRDPQRPV